MKVYLESLGCAKNRVDSELMLGKLASGRHMVTTDPADAELIVVNTCSFIESAVQESIDTILELARYKTEGVCRRLVVAGCLPERYRGELAGALPEVDLFLGTGALDQIMEAVEGAEPARGCRLPDPRSRSNWSSKDPRLVSTFPSVYLKIAEGCSRRCTYCIIPRLRGPHRSRFMDDLLTESEQLVAGGARELVLVAQESTDYGTDLDPPADLGGLLAHLASRLPDVWLRVLYGHPASLAESMIRTMAGYPNICPYFDLPIQHASDAVLKRMGRGYTRADLHRLFHRIRTILPDAVLRTTVITGFPGETDRDFNILLDFIREIGFDHLGVFTYSDADDLPSHRLPEPVDPVRAGERRDQLMSLQQEISQRCLKRHLNQQVQVLVEGAGHNKEAYGIWGRTMGQAPEVDGVTRIHCGSTVDLPAPGQLVTVRVTEVREYDLYGELECRS